MLKKFLLIGVLLSLVWPVWPAEAAAVTVLSQAKTSEKVIALTFDDGWDNRTCQAVRQILADHGVLATIFPVGSWAAGNSSVLKDFLADGHELGNHSMTHPKLTMLSLAQQERELREAQAVLERIGGQQATNFMRPPYGAYDKNTLQAAARLGLQPITWSIDSWDWRDIPVEQVVRRTVDAAKPGGVILMHLAGRNTVKALPRIIKGLQDKGYTFVKLSQLFGQAGAPSHVSAGSPVQITYQQEPITLQPGAKLIGGVTYVPCREFLQHFGWRVVWNGTQQAALCQSGSSQLLIHARDENQAPGITGRLIGGKLYVPLRAIAGQLGLQISWDGQARTVNLR
ncbi:MAG: polysaccharide deacetylase family protein [Firmicutes bacterium]|nr:polysaccharide deacetylase family protein [Bacillota bacterium]